MSAPSPLAAGPWLGLEDEWLYSICFLSPPSCTAAAAQVAGKNQPAKVLATTPHGVLWRAEWLCQPSNQDQWINYSVYLDGQPASSKTGSSQWTFFVPGSTHKPRIAYASCNGFSDLKLMNSTERPMQLWETCLQQHTEQPFGLLLLGGDQVYADSIWSSIPALREWNTLPLPERIKRKPSAVLLNQIDKFYSQLYCDRWATEPLAQALASIPHLMMWDDHDIFDGWGSYPQALQACPMYQAIYQSAAKYFELFQLRGASQRKGRMLGAAKTTATATNTQAVPRAHYSLTLNFRGHTIIALDNRSQRSITRIMDESHWQDFFNTLNRSTTGNLLLMIGVPVVYRDFSFVEKTMDATPWEEELSDDLKDHWRAREHQGERARLIMRLLDNAKQRQGKTLILSGDVHVGCLGVVQDKSGPNTITIHQVVSSGIVHPAPTALQWAGIVATTNDDCETLDENHLITTRMVKAFGAGIYFRTRNFVTLQTGSDNKLWLNWICENGEQPSYPCA
jgi:hypothetical protein